MHAYAGVSAHNIFISNFHTYLCYILTWIPTYMYIFISQAVTKRATTGLCHEKEESEES